MSRVCIVIPTYQESENLPRLIEELEKTLKGEDFQLLVVDDNSPDGTADMAEKMNRHYKNILVHRRKDRFGIGEAIRDGFKIATSRPKCEYIVTMDADLSHNPKEIPRLLRETKNCDLVQGSRYVKGGHIIGWSPSRRTMSYLANLLCKLLFKTGLHDHTSNFRAYSRKCAEAIITNTHCRWYEWTIDAILVAKDHDFKVKEVPITFVNRTLGKSKLRTFHIFMWIQDVSKLFLRRRLNRS